MRISLIIEGSYPYVNGGMSSWAQQLMLSMPDVEFVVQSIAATRKETKEFKYKIPDNVVEIQEVYLMDDDYVSRATQSRLKLSSAEYDAFESLLFGEQADWEAIIRFFLEKPVSLNALLSGEDFLRMVRSYYQKHYERIVFVDFLWTMRSMYLPLFTMLKSRTVKADLYHTASSGYAAIWGSMQKVLYNKPFLLSEHGLYTREREEEIIRADWVKGIYKDLWIAQFRKIGLCGYHYADKVTALFEDARQFQVELGCDPQKTLVIPNGVDTERFRDCPGKEPGDKNINIGAVLRVTPIKDVKTLLSAFSLARQKDERLRLYIMGSLEEAPDYAAECRQLVEELAIPDVTFTGVVNTREYIGKMDMLVLSSLSEGQPLAILEGFAAKKPFIATNVGNCAGLLEGEFDDWGQAGYIVPIMSVSQMARAMLRMAADAKKRQEMGEIGYRRVQAFYDQSEIYRKYAQLYRRMIEQSQE